MNHSKLLKSGLLILMIGIILCLSWAGAVTFSALPVPWTAPWDMISHPQSASLASTLLFEVRFPRLVAAVLTGSGFAVAGVLMQTLSKNPLASPGLFGVNAGAALGVALASTCLQYLPLLSQPVAAIFGGAAAWCVVMLLGKAGRAGHESKRLVLAGIAVSALCGAVTKTILILAEDQATSVMTWLAGSFAGISWQHLFWSAPVLVTCLIISCSVSPQLNLLLLGDDRAKTLGVRLGVVRFITNMLLFVLVGVCVSCVGAIAFVGLIGPHIARFFLVMTIAGYYPAPL